MSGKLFKAHGVFWEPIDSTYGDTFLGDNPFCSNDACRSPLAQANLGTSKTGQYIHGWLCTTCGKEYECPGNDYQELIRKVNRTFEGHKRLGHEIYSLDLAPTQIKDDAEDENYWVQARLGEKNGKRMAVIYFGEKIKGKQNKDDYVQSFIDVEDEQLRFDKNNKNPMKLLVRLEAEFPNSTVEIKRKELDSEA